MTESTLITMTPEEWEAALSRPCTCSNGDEDSCCQDRCELAAEVVAQSARREKAEALLDRLRQNTPEAIQAIERLEEMEKAGLA